MDTFQNLIETPLQCREVFHGDRLRLFADTVTLPNGKTALREYVRHIGAVGIVPVTEDGSVLVERQFRYPVNRIITEIPAGKLNDPGEDRLSAARRELEEETGFTAGEWIPLGDYCPAAAYCDEVIALYLARNLQPGTRCLDEDEFLNVQALPLARLVEEIMDGTITDGKTQTGILKAARYLGIL